MTIRERLRQFLLQHKKSADSFLFLLSCLALGIFVSNEFVALKPNALMMEPAQWASLQMIARTGIWLCFVAHFSLYGMLSGNLFRYLREHIIELLICIAWFPHHNVSLLQDFTRVLSVETVQLVGMLANGFLVVRHFVRSVTTHPIIVTGSVFLLVIITASEMLMQVEPQTFPNLFDAIWYSVVTTTTIGYGDIVPHTFSGRCIGIGLMITGISLAGTFIAIVSQSLQRRFGQHGEKQEMLNLQQRVEKLEAQNVRLTEALERDNELKQQLLSLLQKQEKPEQK